MIKTSRSLCRRSFEYLRCRGPVATVRHIFQRVRRNLIPPLRQVLRVCLAEFQPPPEAADREIAVREYSSFRDVPPDLLEEIFYKGTIDDEAPCSREAVSAFFTWLFARGATFWACSEGENLVGNLWTLRGSADVFRFHFFPLSSADAALLAHEIFPPYRGRGLNRIMTHRVLGELKAGGVERAYVDVLLTGTRSLKSFSKTSFLPVGQARMKCFRKRAIVIWRRPGGAPSL